MPFVVKDRVKVTSTTTGTGTFTLGAAATGFQSFASLGTNSGWNISTAQVLQSFAVGAQDTSPRGLFFKPDGLKMYVVGDASPEVNEYNLSTAWDVRTSSFLQTFSISAQGTSARGLFFRSDGLKMYVVFDGNETVAEYNLSSAWNISTASYLQNFSVAGENTQPRGIFFKPDGLKMYVAGGTVDEVNEYDLSSAWNISTASFLQVYAIAQDGDVFGLFFKPDGLGMYITGATNSSVYQYSLSSAWNISTSSYVRALSVVAQESSPQSVFFKPDGSVMYITGNLDGDRVWQYLLSSNQTYYCIANGTDWEVGVGTVSDDGLSLSRDTVLESSNSNALVNWGAGSKDVFCTFPSDATEGTVPTADNSSVGTDLYAWTNLKKQLDAGVINGVPYNNRNISGMISTYSLVYSGANAYSGGVLAPNGDIHFIPWRSPRGQKVSITGVVSTYALVSSITTSTQYDGGVLASNGDIHFVPRGALVGQKVNASGVVSTYSLIVQGGYNGGVLAPNGSIYFVPYGAAVGQIVSAAGVVSTYSLIYTTTNAYKSGVLAPNGDIHFIPASAARGQKVSAAGVVSTYSLIYTAALAYAGGVLAPNGDIHFVPWNTPVGQKISATGVVSTYSLIQTIVQGYSGGVLAPNGDIHFVPFDSVVGQKISAAGVVSTYSLAYTAAGGALYSGGILGFDGSIYFVPQDASANRIGEKIATNTTRPIGYALSPFFNKF
jgi:hypothetical protein